MTIPTIIARSGPELSGREVYEIWRIRDVVFAVEQQCDEPDVDGVDLADDCTHLWIADDNGIVQSYLRTYVADGVRKVGRVATLKEARGKGLSGALIREVLSRWGDQEIRIGAQAYLEDWYGAFGFVTSGPHYDEAGIDHIPMTRQAGAQSGV
ncbi:GNAT family N-acetyltransferase [Aeromicrobium choanae]|uniref:ElaA protein n=1 Tax=Aeromicrobium choanae TaxID=1736691 RepID=A0A1T4Z7W2_9ACTN|nr:GNAT family N-acetyltransferase [Aeromicrobium choanae]SKB10112.1 ElaA protein [Aeromicrobium choanae]